jgi:hypothetical protein
LDAAIASGDIRELQIRFWRHGQLRDRLSKRAFAGQAIAGQQVGAAKLGERFAGRIRSPHGLAQRLDGLVERNAIAAALGAHQPHMSERGVDLRRIGKTIHRAPQRKDRRIVAARPRLCEPDGDHAIRIRGLQRRKRLELVDGASVIAILQIHVRQSLARGRLTGRRAARGLLQRLAGGGKLIEIALGEAEDVIRIAHCRVDCQRFVNRRHRVLDATGSIAGEPEFIQDARILFVERHERFVALNRAGGTAERQVDVAKRFEGAQRTGIEIGGAAKIAQRGFELVLRLVNGPTLIVGEHGIRLKGNGAAIRFDRLKWAFGDHRGVTGGDIAVEFPLVGEGAKRQGPGNANNGHEHDGNDGSTHREKW